MMDISNQATPYQSQTKKLLTSVSDPYQVGSVWLHHPSWLSPLSCRVRRVEIVVSRVLRLLPQPASTL